MNADGIKHLYSTLVRCCDEQFALSDRMQAAGFAAFKWRSEFEESFCDTEEERNVHRRCEAEIAKMRLARQTPVDWRTNTIFYRSALIEDLRKRRDAENGCDGNEVRNRFPNEPWRRELDPCQRKFVQARMRDRTFEPRWQVVVASEARTLADEATKHRSGLSSGHAFDQQGRFAFLRAVLEREMAPLGFAFDARKSSLGYPVFSKRLLPDLDLCWTLEEGEFFVFTPSDGNGNYQPSLQLRRPDTRGRLNKAAKNNPVNLLIIAYAVALPHFEGAYRKFRNLDELETIAKAHLHLYSLLAPTIDEAVPQAFNG